MTDPEANIVKSRESLEFARYALAGGGIPGRQGAAPTWRHTMQLSHSSSRTSKAPKTHNGARSELARLARDEPRISREQISLLGWSYEVKNVADYE